MKIAPVWGLLLDYLLSPHKDIDADFYLYQWDNIRLWGEFNALESHIARPWGKSYFVICSFDTDIPF